MLQNCFDIVSTVFAQKQSHDNPFLTTPSASQCGRCSYALGSSELRVAEQATASPISNPAMVTPNTDARPADDGGASSAIGAAAAAAAEPTDLEARIELLEADLLKVRRLVESVRRD